MAQNISLNAFDIKPIVGLYVYMANLPQLHNVIVSPNQETPLMAGAVVTIDGTVTNPNAPVAKQAAVTDEILGVIAYSPIVNQFTLNGQYIANDRIAVARENDIIWMAAAGAITAGSILYFNANNQVTSTATAGNTIIGIALTPAIAENDLVQVELKFQKTQAAGG